MLRTHYCIISNYVSSMEKLYHLTQVCGLLLGGGGEEEFVVL